MVMWKKMLLIALSVSFYQMLITMNDEVIVDINPNKQLSIVQDELLNLQEQLDIEKRALLLLKFTRDQSHKNAHLSLVGFWLECQRQQKNDCKAWNTLVDRFLSATKEKNKLIEELRGESCLHCERTTNVLTLKVLEVVDTIARDLQPGQMCSEPLIDNVKLVIKKHYEMLRADSNDEFIFNDDLSGLY